MQIENVENRIRERAELSNVTKRGGHWDFQNLFFQERRLEALSVQFRSLDAFSQRLALSLSFQPQVLLYCYAHCPQRMNHSHTPGTTAVIESKDLPFVRNVAGHTSIKNSQQQGYVKPMRLLEA